MAAAAIMLLACQAGLAAAAPCDDTPGVSMTARHYNYDLLKVCCPVRCVVHGGALGPSLALCRSLTALHTEVCL